MIEKLEKEVIDLTQKQISLYTHLYYRLTIFSNSIKDSEGELTSEVIDERFDIIRKCREILKWEELIELKKEEYKRIRFRNG